MIFLPARPGDTVSGQLVTIDPLQLEAAEKRDAETAGRLPKQGS
jgi:hypothetical protein